MTLISVGFAQELSYGDRSGGSLRDLVGGFSDPNLDDVVRYLKSGHPVAIAPGISRDVLSDDQEIIGAVGVFHDGTYMWPRDLPYYVEKYRLALPNEFLAHMKSQNWAVPPIDIDDDS
jgi:hypothetical protein